MALNTRRRLNQADDVKAMTLADLCSGQIAEVTEIASADSGRLMKLASLGVVPGCTIRLQQRRPAYVILVGETLLSLDQAVAADIRVSVYP